MLFFFLRDREGEMEMAIAVVRRDDASRHRDRLSGGSLAKEQQDLLIRDAKCAKTVIVYELRKSEEALIEFDGSIERFHVERTFQEAADAGHASLNRISWRGGQQHGRLWVGLIAGQVPSISTRGRVAQLAEQVTLNH